MIKIILVLIASILVILGIYAYTNQTTQKSSPIPTVSKKEKKVNETEKVSVLVPEVKEKKSLEQTIDVKSPDTQVQNRVEENNLEEKSYLDIENDSQLNNQERDALIAAKAYREVSEDNGPGQMLTEEETIYMINNDEFIKQYN